MPGFNRFQKLLSWIMLILLICVSVTALADSYEKVYGLTKDRIRVRAKASLSADIIDNLRADSCVYLLSREKNGGTTFVKLRYRNAEGKIGTGYAALKSNGTVYIEVLTDKEAESRFSVSGGKLPSTPAGVMSSAERDERKNGDAAGKEDKNDSKEANQKDTEETSEAVREAQQGLSELGIYSGEITGHAGNKTIAAIKAFQKSKGIKETGEPDTATLSAIHKAVSKSKEQKSASAVSTESIEKAAPSASGLKVGSTGSSVRTLQKNLTALGYYYGEITGHYGEKTGVAVRKFQKENGLKETGVADKETQKRIASAAARTVKTSSASNSKASSGSRIYNLDWFKAKENGLFSKLGFAAGKTANLKDLTSGKTLQVRIQSSGYHLDVEPLTEKDTKTLCSIYGVKNAKDIGFERRPMLLTTVHGYRIACSCYGTPHGTKLVRGNNYPGQFCLHFLNSKTSGSGVVDNGHQAAVRRAVASFGSNRVVKLDELSDLE